MKHLAAVLLLVAASTVATPMATAEPPPDGAPAPSATPAPAPMPAPAQLSPPGQVPPLRPARDPDEYEATGLMQIVIGTAAGAAGLWAGAYLGFQTECAGGCDGEFGGLGGALLGAAIGLTAGTTAGVMIAGTDRDHEASVALTCIGAAAGGAAGVGLAQSMEDVNVVSVTAILAASAAIGGTVMHRLTRVRRAPAVQLVPFTAGGGTVGLSLVGTTF